MVGDEDPRAPYKVYEGDELRGTYATRAEARRRQQQLESEQANISLAGQKRPSRRPGTKIGKETEP
jgi:hypothetical protein